MTTADARPQFLTKRILGVMLLIAAVFMAGALQAPHADAAKKKQRIVAISPFAAQTMVQLGVKPMRVGQTLGATDRQRKLLRGIKALPLSHPNGPNLEVMAKLRPDIVFSSKQWEAGHAALKSLGIKVVIADPLAPGSVYGSVKKVGRVIGKNKQANRLVKKLRNQVRSATSGISGTRPRVLVVLGIGRTAMAFLHNSWGGQIMKLAGASLVTGGATANGGFARISDEVVVAENPDIIVVVPHGSLDDIDEVAKYISENQAWQTTNAWKEGKIFTSVDNRLLQAGTDVGPTINSVRREYLRNR